MMSQTSRPSAVPLDRPLLAKVLTLMQSPVPGEALQAMRRANRMLADADETWPALLIPPEAAPFPGVAYVAPQIVVATKENLLPPYGRTWREAVRWLINQGAELTEREDWTLDRIAQRLAQGSDTQRPRITPDEAAEVRRIYASLMGGAGR